MTKCISRSIALGSIALTLAAMTTNRFHRFVNLFGAVVLAMGLAAQPASADDDDRDDDNGGGRPVITDVFVDESAGELTIVGKGFKPSSRYCKRKRKRNRNYCRNRDPIVTLGNDPQPLVIVSAMNTEIVAILPLEVEVGLSSPRLAP